MKVNISNIAIPVNCSTIDSVVDMLARHDVKPYEEIDQSQKEKTKFLTVFFIPIMDSRIWVACEEAEHLMPRTMVVKASEAEDFIEQFLLETMKDFYEKISNTSNL